MVSVPLAAERPSSNSLHDLLQGFALQEARTALGAVQYRQAGPTDAKVSHVLLHGIGSNSASWVHQLHAAQEAGGLHRVLAWDAPGYGHSEALIPTQPSAADYAHRLWAWLDAINADGPLTLVGHSLGCLMATAAALQQAPRVRRLVLLAPALGYARATDDDRNRRTQERLRNLQELGPEGLAQKRGAAMLSATATAEQLDYARWVMGQVRPDGYAQATHMLAHGDLLSMLPQVRCPVLVASGDQDNITPPAGCQSAAQAATAPYVSLVGAGHLCAVQLPAEVTRLAGVLDPTSPGTPAGTSPSA
jgi:pimeloyl-ACP methyl ester carboxylesterase